MVSKSTIFLFIVVFIILGLLLGIAQSVSDMRSVSPVEDRQPPIDPDNNGDGMAAGFVLDLSSYT